MYAQQAFLALFTVALNTAYVEEVWKRGFPAGLWLALVSSERDLFERGKHLPIFYRGLMCVCCVCVCMHTHTHSMWGIRM
jgi:hypothetical protein